MIGHPKPQSRAGERKARRAAKAAQWDKVRAAAMRRDGRRCRACNSRDQVEGHHVKFRSLGGEHLLSNTAALCSRCHADVHAYRLTLSGDANGTLKIERIA